MPDIKLIYGDEDFFIDEEIKKLKSKVSSDFGFERLEGKKGKLNAVLSAVMSLPMFAAEKLVVIDGLECDEDDEEKLLSALNSTPKGVTVVLLYYGSPDKRRRLYKKLEKISQVLEFKQFNDWERDKVISWITDRALKLGKSIDSATADLLIDIVGMNLRTLDKELEKLSTFKGNGRSIGEQDVLNMASSGEIDAFQFSNFIRDKDLKSSMEILARLYKDKEDPNMLIGMLARLYRMLIQVKYFEDRGKGQQEIAMLLKTKPFFVKKCMEKTNRFGLNELQNNIKLLHVADLKLKSGYDTRAIMETLVMELCNGK